MWFSTDPVRESGPLYAFPVFGLLAFGIAAVALGIARGAIDQFDGLALCEQPIIEKRRHVEIVGGKRWEIDVFAGANAGLVIAELELSSEDEAYERPAWLGDEVSGDPRYYNNNLIARPYRSW